MPPGIDRPSRAAYRFRAGTAKGGLALRRRRSLPSVPAFRNDEEEFEFWDTHDVEDYLTGETVSLDSILGPEDAAPSELGMPIESLFTPEGIEWVDATRAAERPRRKRARA